jgi:hypothetical protein
MHRRLRRELTILPPTGSSRLPIAGCAGWGMLAPANSPGWAAGLRRCLIGIQRPAGAGRWRLGYSISSMRAATRPTAPWSLGRAGPLGELRWGQGPGSGERTVEAEPVAHDNQRVLRVAPISSTAPLPPTLGGDATLQAKRQLHPTKYRPPRGRVYQASVVIPLSLRDPRDARRARVSPFTMDLLKAACYARRSGFVPTRALSGTFSRPGDGATGTRRGTLMEYPQGHRGACTRTVPKPVACCLNCRFVESFTRQRSCRPPQAA